MAKIFTLSLLGLSSAFAGQLDNRGTIQWGACADPTWNNMTPPIQCSTLDVPLDYTKPEGANNTLKLVLARTPAIKQPSKGSVMINFGGPGGPGGGNLAVEGIAAMLQGISGGHFDLVTWDPRGTVDTLPFDCYPPAQAIIAADSVLRDTANSSDIAVPKLWAEAGGVINQCTLTQGSNATLIGTTSTAHDMMKIVDALGEDGLLRYWGWSYGSYLGSVAAALYPDRVERMVLDANTNSHEYLDGREFEIYSQTDSALRAVFSECLSRPTNCGPLAAGGNRTLPDLVAIWETAVASLRADGAVVAGPTTLAVSDLLGIVLDALYKPLTPSLPGAMGLIDALHTRNATGLALHAGALPPADPDVAVTGVTGWLTGIRCAERRFRTDSMDEAYETQRRLMSEEVSPWFGESHWAVLASCMQWPWTGKGAYAGDFAAATRRPALVIGSPYDPTTPLVSAHNVSANLEGSVVLQHNGFGHVSHQNPSSCTNGWVEEYLLHGTLPEEGTVCEPDEPIFNSPPVIM